MGLILKLVRNVFSHQYVDPKYIFGENPVKIGSLAWTLELPTNIQTYVDIVQKPFFELSTYSKMDISSEKSK